MTRPAAFAACVGAACGVVGGVAGAWIVTGAYDAAGAGRIGTDLLEARAARAAVIAEVVERVRALETEIRSGGAGAPAASALSQDLRALRDAIVRDLGRTETRLADIEARLDELTALAALTPPPARTAGPPDDEEESGWVNLAADSDPLRRFSALARLGRYRTDRSVRASLEALRDPAEIVVWQAVRNLGRFDERSAARSVAPLLRHDSVSLRNVAWESLRRLGAPDVQFDPAATPEHRREAAAALERWAAEAE